MAQPTLHAKPRAGLLQDALKSACDTKLLIVRAGALGEVPAAFRSQFGKWAAAIVIADENTYRVAGQAVQAALGAAGIAADAPFLFRDPELYAEYRFVEELDRVLAKTKAIPIAVGSGTINDLTKLCAFRAGRQYLSVPTAASMDGYTAYGSSITFQGSKQTFDCPAPLAVVADLDVVCAAPPAMNASGYADLMAKLPAGADWIVADMLGEESIDRFSWEMVQEPLMYWLSDPEGVKAGNPEAIARLLEGLMMGGFAMQHLKSSRPASGAEHQFSHLWDMQHHTHEGHAPSHGFKVGIGTLASIAMYEELLRQDLTELDVEEAVAKWPDWPQMERDIATSLGTEELGEKGVLESKTKYIDQKQLRSQLELLTRRWPEIRERLKSHLSSLAEISDLLAAAGAPIAPGEIGIPTARLRESYRQAYYIRRRFTVLDLAMRAGLFDSSLDGIFQNGLWRKNASAYSKPTVI